MSPSLLVEVVCPEKGEEPLERRPVEGSSEVSEAWLSTGARGTSEEVGLGLCNNTENMCLFGDCPQNLHNVQTSYVQLPCVDAALAVY